MSYKEDYTELLRANFLKYMRLAFKLLPKMNNPKILDPGCGTGIPTIELASFTNGEIIAIDIDQQLIEVLNEKVKEMNLKDRIIIKKMSFLKNDFSDNYFDLIWEEGVFHIIGFKKSFKECYRILRPGGYLVLSQTIKNLEKTEHLITKCGFRIINELKLPEGCWWTEYYEPLEKMVINAHQNKELLKNFKNTKNMEEEIRMVKTNPKEYDCAYYILQKE